MREQLNNTRKSHQYLPTFQNAHGGFACKIAVIVLKNLKGGLQIHFNVVFLASSYFYKPLGIEKIIVLFKIVDKIALSKFQFGSLHGGNPPQIVTVGRYGTVLQTQNFLNSLTIILIKSCDFSACSAIHKDNCFR